MTDTPSSPQAVEGGLGADAADAPGRRAHRLLRWRLGEQSARRAQATQPVARMLFAVDLLVGLPVLVVGLVLSSHDQWHPLVWVGLGVTLAPVAWYVVAEAAMMVVNVLCPVRAATVEAIEQHVYRMAARARTLPGPHRDPVTGMVFAAVERGDQVRIAALAPTRPGRPRLTVYTLGDSGVYRHRRRPDTAAAAAVAAGDVPAGEGFDVVRLHTVRQLAEGLERATTPGAA